jgi:hypothetical protein
MPWPHPTILRPPPLNPAMSALENDLDITALGVLGEVRTLSLFDHLYV